jgi:hypothetical protein
VANCRVSPIISSLVIAQPGSTVVDATTLEARRLIALLDRSPRVRSPSSVLTGMNVDSSDAGPPLQAVCYA